MHRIDGPGATSGGGFREGDPTTGESSTWVTADWANAVQEELANVIEAAGLTLNKADNTQLLAAMTVFRRLACPVGTVWEGYDTAAPAGTLLLAGQVVSRATYPALTAHAVSKGLVVSEVDWAATSWTLFGAGDGSTTIRLPDLREEFVRGVGTGRTVGSWQASDNKSHGHGVNDPGHSHHDGDSGVAPGTTTGGGFAAINNAGSGAGSSTGSSFTGISIQASGGSEARPRNVSLLRCIYF